jgi:hypothetical protein
VLGAAWTPPVPPLWTMVITSPVAGPSTAKRSASSVNDSAMPSPPTTAASHTPITLAAPGTLHTCPSQLNAPTQAAALAGRVTSSRERSVCSGISGRPWSRVVPPAFSAQCPAVVVVVLWPGRCEIVGPWPAGTASLADRRGKDNGVVDIRSRWRALLFGGLAIAVVAASFLTWFRYDVYGVSADRGHYIVRLSVDAWRGSTLWTLTVLFGLVGALSGIVSAFLRQPRATMLIFVVGLASAAVSVGLWLRQWWLIQHPGPPGRLVAVAQQGFVGPANAYGIKRDHLADYVRYNGHGQYATQTTSSVVAVILVAVIAVALVVTLGYQHYRRPRPTTSD